MKLAGFSLLIKAEFSSHPGADKAVLIDDGCSWLQNIDEDRPG